jgi:hypothetical protein
MMNPFEKDRTLDEYKSDTGNDGIRDETLVGHTHYNLFPLNLWMILWIPPLFDELQSVLSRDSPVLCYDSRAVSLHFLFQLSSIFSTLGIL